MAGRMAGAEAHLQYMLAQADGVAILKPARRLKGPRWRKTVGSGRHGQAIDPKLIARMRPDDGQAQALGQVLRSRRMVHMGMGNPDLFERHAQTFGCCNQKIQIAAGIDDGRLVGLVAPNNRAVLLERGNGDSFVVEHGLGVGDG